jgi:hypothetical protein
MLFGPWSPQVAYNYKSQVEKGGRRNIQVPFPKSVANAVSAITDNF